MTPRGKCPICESKIASVYIKKEMYTGLTCQFSCVNGCEWETREHRVIYLACGKFVDASHLLGRTYEAKFENEELICHLVELTPIPKDIVAEPILAWRIWNVVIPTAVSLDQTKIDRMQREMRDGYDPFSGLLSPTLTGVGVAQDWDSPTHHATCEAHAQPYMALGHQRDLHVPAENCSCGVWALKDEATMLGQLQNYSKGLPMAYGQVHLWGRIFEHKKGFRGEYASPVSISVFGVDAEVVEQLGAKYGCEAKVGVPALPVPTSDERVTSILSSAGMTSVNWFGRKPFPLTTSSNANISVTNFPNSYVFPNSYAAVSAAANEEFPEEPVSFRDKLKHPWSKGPLKWMYDPYWRLARSDDSWPQWTFKFRAPIGFSLILTSPLSAPLYYLKRALTR